jgi:ubiquinone/menaquinone biosynthesis C-methylase UbiE
MKPALPTTFAELYLALRKKENRLYGDEELARLPGITKNHPHYKEWKARKFSCRRLVHYIRKKGTDLHIAEIGCGNGWLAAQMAAGTTGMVTGIDINPMEMEQAKRVFKHLPNLEFLNSRFEKDDLKGRHFDMIVFAASIQYFASLKDLIDTALHLLNQDGELHILDSPVYLTRELEAAEKRSEDYFTTAGFPEMAQYYFHHNLDELRSFNLLTLYNPAGIMNKLLGHSNPFPHFVIKKKPG